VLSFARGRLDIDRATCNSDTRRREETPAPKRCKFREPAKANFAAYLWYLTTTLNNFSGLCRDTKRLKAIAANPPCYQSGLLSMPSFFIL
jgi:hypothetical protein